MSVCIGNEVILEPALVRRRVSEMLAVGAITVEEARDLLAEHVSYVSPEPHWRPYEPCKGEQ